MSAVRRDGDDILLTVHAQPGARQTAFAGLHGEALKIRVQAPPMEGRANQALQRFLAEVFAVPQAQVVLISGPTARHKRWRIARPTQLPDWLLPLLA